MGGGVAVAGLVGLTYSAYHHSLQSDHTTHLRSQHLLQALHHPASYQGYKRDQEASLLTSKLPDSLVVLYSPTVTGKSHLAMYIHSTANRPVLFLTGKPTLQATIQQHDPSDSHYSDSSIQSFQNSISSALSESKNPILILDSPEIMPEILRQKMIVLASRVKKAGKADALVVTSSMETVEVAEACGEVQVHVSGEWREEELMAVAASLGMDRKQAEEVIRQWGPSLEVLLSSKSNPDSPAVLLDTYLHRLTPLLSQRPDLHPAFQRILDTVTPVTPLGNTYSDSEPAQILYKAGILAKFPNKSLRFRSKIAVKALEKVLISHN